MEQVKITAAEYEIMNILWEKGEGTSRELSEILQETVGWKGATTKTLLGRLVKKSILLTQKEGGRFLYRPAISENKALGASVEEFIAQICPRALGEVAVHLVNLVPMDSLSIKKLTRILGDKVPNDHIECNCIPNKQNEEQEE